jgi:hypothetical protein
LVFEFYAAPHEHSGVDATLGEVDDVSGAGVDDVVGGIRVDDDPNALAEVGSRQEHGASFCTPEFVVPMSIIK